MKCFIKFFICLLLASPFSALATPPSQIIGPSTVSLNQVATYSYDNGFAHLDYQWYVTKGTVQSTSVSGTEYSVTILWTTPGSGTIEFDEDTDLFLASKTVTINSC